MSDRSIPQPVTTNDELLAAVYDRLGDVLAAVQALAPKPPEGATSATQSAPQDQPAAEVPGDGEQADKPAEPDGAKPRRVRRRVTGQ